MNDTNKNWHFKYSVRAIVVHDDKLLLVRNVQKDGTPNDFLCLPGGRVESGESLEEALERELLEELGVKPEVGRLLFVNQWRVDKNATAAPDFIFKINNSEGFVNADLSKASHNFELAEVGFFPFDTKEAILPSWIMEELSANTTDRPIKYISELES